MSHNSNYVVEGYTRGPVKAIPHEKAAAVARVTGTVYFRLLYKPTTGYEGPLHVIEGRVKDPSEYSRLLTCVQKRLDYVDDHQVILLRNIYVVHATYHYEGSYAS